MCKNKLAFYRLPYYNDLQCIVMGVIRMLEKNYQCKACGFQFKVSLTEQELNAGNIPCPGCAETALEEINEDVELSIMSRGAECSGNCQCCAAHGTCDGADINKE